MPAGVGYPVVLGNNVNKTKGFVAASEDERAADLNEMFRREDIKGYLLPRVAMAPPRLST